MSCQVDNVYVSDEIRIMNNELRHTESCYATPIHNS